LLHLSVASTLSCCNSAWLPCQANCLCLAQLCCCLLQRCCCGLPPYLLHSLHFFSSFPIDRPRRQPVAPSSIGAMCKLLLLCSTFHGLPHSKPSLRPTPPACRGWLLLAPSVVWLLPLAVVLLSLPFARCCTLRAYFAAAAAQASSLCARATTLLSAWAPSASTRAPASSRCHAKARPSLRHAVCFPPPRSP
jgi:hypothetical protein